MNSIKISNDTYWIGTLKFDSAILDMSIYTPYGTTYNSFLVKGSKKVALFDIVKEKDFDSFIESLKEINISLKNIDFLILTNTSPDHLELLPKILKFYPNLTIVGSSNTISSLKKILNNKFNYKIINDRDVIDLGNKSIQFIFTPFVHWPDSMCAYIVEDRILISGSCFSAHYCSSKIFSDEISSEENYLDSIRSYYDSLLKPYRIFLSKAIESFQNLEINLICPSHGPIIRHNPLKLVSLYKKLSSYSNFTNDNKKVCIFYSSSSGCTEKIAKAIYNGISSTNQINVKLLNIVNVNTKNLIKEIYNCHGVLFGSPTIATEISPPMKVLLANLNPLCHGGRYAASFGSYGWSGEAVTKIDQRLLELKMNLFSPGLKIKLNPNKEDLIRAYEFGVRFCKFMLCEQSINQMKSVKHDKALYNIKFIKNKSSALNSSELDYSLKKINTKDDFVIIGNGISAFTAAKTIRAINSTCKITIISSSKISSYDKSKICHMSNKSNVNDIYLERHYWYKKNNIIEILNCTAKSINEYNKTILLENDEIISYSKLIIASGSLKKMPNCKIVSIDENNSFTSNKLDNLNNVYSILTIQDMIELNENLSSDKDVTILGAGPLGLEIASTINKYSKSISIIEKENHVLNKILDFESSIILNTYIKNNKIDLYTKEKNVEILIKDNNVSGVKLKNGHIINTDILILATGLTPNLSLLKNSSIKTNKGVLIDNKMCTNVDNIYACGDIVEYNNNLFNTNFSAKKTGFVAACNACGLKKSFDFNEDTHLIEALNTNIFSVGNLDLKNTSYDTLSSKTLNNDEYCKLFFKDNILIGAILIGNINKSKLITEGIKNKLNKKEVLLSNLI